MLSPSSGTLLDRLWFHSIIRYVPDYVSFRYVWPTAWGHTYRYSYAICISTNGLTIVLCYVFRQHLASLNRKAQKGVVNGKSAYQYLLWYVPSCSHEKKKKCNSGCKLVANCLLKPVWLFVGSRDLLCQIHINTIGHQENVETLTKPYIALKCLKFQ